MLIDQYPDADFSPPTVGGDGNIYTSNVGSDSVTLTWTVASDTFTSTNQLQYMIYTSTTNLSNTIETWEENATAYGGWKTATDTVTVTGLQAETQYYFIVITQDEAQNRSIYQSVNATTSTAAMPIVMYGIGSRNGNLGDPHYH
ncbi:MAG: hypothetical protein OMM_05905 [Candidatus Magnetoglobus multicellularis str. Araruama]|uniref:Fibronectin type-III domain-containing protein n=1 Tax=Candidatus Magnetoglobus multicellularis str. Araruama TaxID=890399 RepID=A0A1V1NTB4_9BACT|nr:MAG: hypothetical protein OMM_05905 [Candidatus Magnetoglobus multicellularis str. Araruama]